MKSNHPPICMLQREGAERRCENMRIASSNVAMSSSHQETKFSYKQSMTMEAAASKNLAGAIFTKSEEMDGADYRTSMLEYKKQQEQEAAQKRKENEERSAKEMLERTRNTNQTNSCGRLEMSDQYKIKLELIMRMFELMRQGKSILDAGLMTSDSKNVLDLRSPFYRNQDATNAEGTNNENVETELPVIGTTGSGTIWQRVTATSGFYTEAESTTFATSGIVRTVDGRDINFNMEVSMSRAFTASINSLEVESYIKTDPLMINLDTDIGSVSDQKFFFDLDADGKEDEISFAGKGSGFLALDRNGDGKINDGSELFGTKSGDGFKDLAAYDEDGNGWIDENDAIFSQLKIWTKDEDGKDKLISLKDADVGAIYLGNADTQFSLKDEDHKLNGEIKKTGIYLHESSGEVGTVNHVDLIV